MDVRPADILVMKKPHPCGSQTMYVIRAGNSWCRETRSNGESNRFGEKPPNRDVSECMPVHIVTERKAGTQICWKSFGKWKKTITRCRKR